MLHAQIERALEVNGALFNALAVAQEMPTLTSATKWLQQQFARSQIYVVVRETPETTVVKMNAHAVARLGSE